MVPDPSLTLNEGVIAPFKSGNYYPQVLRAVAQHVGSDADTPWEDMPKKAQKALLHGLGNEKVRVDYRTVDGRDTYWYIEWEGVLAAVKRRYTEAQSDAQREKLSAYFATVPCETCGGKRLKPEVLAVTVNDKSIHDVTEMSAAESLAFFEGLHFTGQAAVIALPIVKEIRERLRFLVDVGLDYLTLERATATLSGGEAQRIRLATQIGAGLMGVLYILDEPSIGLHQRDNERLIATLERLRDLATPWWSLGSTTRTPSAPPTTWWTWARAPASTTEATSSRRGRRRRSWLAARLVTADHLSGRRRRIAVPEAPPQAGPRRTEDDRRQGEQPAKRHAGGAHRHAHRGHGVSGSGKSFPYHRHAGAGARQPAEPRPSPHRAPTARSRAWRSWTRSSTSTRAPSAYPALEPGHHIGLWDDIRALFAHGRGQGPRLGYAPLLQRERRPLRGLQGRRPDQDRDALPPRRLRALRGLQRRALQPRDAAGDLPRQEHLRRCSR